MRLNSSQIFNLVTRILYEIENAGLMKTVGATVDEQLQNIKKARDIAYEEIWREQV